MGSQASVFIAHARPDQEVANQVLTAIESLGVRCWQATRDLSAGTEFGTEITNAIHEASILIVLLSPNAMKSLYLQREVEMASSLAKTILPVLLPSFEMGQLSSALTYLISGLSFIEWGKDGKHRLMEVVQRMTVQTRNGDQVPKPVPPRNPVPAKGYVFISYSSHDKDFIEDFKAVLRRRNYGYWDYSESQRDYHSALYKELEQRIEGAAAFICVVSDSWRDSEWPAAEYLYARDAKIPVFVLIAKPLTRPVPILLIQQTRIDFSRGFDQAAHVLEQELDRKNL